MNRYITKLYSYLSQNFPTFTFIICKIKYLYIEIIKKNKELFVITIIPHTENRIVNRKFTLFTVCIIFFSFILLFGSSILIIISFTKSATEITKLETYTKDSLEQLDIYKKGTKELYNNYSTIQSNFDYFNNMLYPSIKSIKEKKKKEIVTEFSELEKIDIELNKYKKYIDDSIIYLKQRQKVLYHTPSYYPVKYSTIQKHYEGILFYSTKNTPIKVTAQGVVVSIDKDKLFGTTIGIEHKYGFVTYYSYCSKIKVILNQKVNLGDIIGYVGKTEFVNSYACFYKIKNGSTFLDPLPFLYKQFK